MPSYDAIRTELSLLLRVEGTDIRSRLRIWHVRMNGRWVEVDPSIVERAERRVERERSVTG